MSTNPYRSSHNSPNLNVAFNPGVVQQSLSTKQQIINELIAGRLKLLEATERFRVAHAAAAACLASATGGVSADADAENMCRTVIGWVCLSLSNRPEEAERVSASLERELQSEIENHGAVTLIRH